MSNKAVFSFLGLFFQDRFSDVFISLCTLVFSSFHIYFPFGWEEPDLWIETFGFKSQVYHILHVWAQASYLTSLSLNFLTYKMRKRSNNHCKGIVREFVDIGHHHWRTTEPWRSLVSVSLSWLSFPSLSSLTLPLFPTLSGHLRRVFMNPRLG